IDVSDGLALDLRRLADASGAGVVVQRVPAADGVTAAQALGGGEDYELLFTAPDPVRVAAAFNAAGLRGPLRIGTVTADPAERRLRDGELPHVGWEHTW
ncbi:MAG: thiamine-phosphate kinase, partial [Acidimicrobiales bacterium]